jgi:type II secretory pathway component GspD/PulD (secretin)
MKMMQILTSVAIMLLTGVVQAKDTEQIINDLKNGEPVAPVIVPDPASVVVTEPAPAVAAPASATVPEEELETVSVAEEPVNENTLNKDGLISVNLKEVELSSVIRLFSTLSGANIIVPELEEGAGVSKVDVSLTNVEWKSALQSILETQGFELYEKNPGTEVYSVRKKPADAPEPLNVKTFKLNYASVSGVSEMITAMVPDPGKISVFPARNTIVVQSTSENLLEIEKMISAIDLPRQQVFIEAKFLELNDSASEKLGIDWQVLGGYNIGINGIGGTFSKSETQTDTTKKLYDMNGVQYETIEDFEYIQNPASTNIVTELKTLIPTFQDDSVKTAGTTLGATLSASDFNLVLAALKETGGSKVVSNPKIIVANEETAQIYIGTKEPNIKQETTQVENTAPITTYNLDPDMPYFEYGIKLDVTPTINTADNISVAITPSLKRFLRNKEAGGNTYPVTTEKTINTRFALESGQTAAIGGLTESDDRDVSRKVPLLGNLPLIGRFFSYSEKSKDQTETIIFVTVGLANPNNINMETGLPQQSSLAMRHTAKMNADRQIKAEELKIYNQMEAERSQAAIQKLHEVEQKRLEKAK